jgi:hypothetical protein
MLNGRAQRASRASRVAKKAVGAGRRPHLPRRIAGGRRCQTPWGCRRTVAFRVHDRHFRLDAGHATGGGMGLGILTSEVTHEAFHHKVLIFAKEPSWIDLSGADTISGKIRLITGNHWGFTTDIYRAMELICAVVRENNLGADEIPNLLVISDMQFNESIKVGRFWRLRRPNRLRTVENQQSEHPETVQRLRR